LGRQENNVNSAEQPVPELTLHGDVIRLHKSGEQIWQVPISEVRAIGEYTNQNGPWSDDWFIVFVGDAGNWFEVPANAPSVQPTLATLGDRLHTPLALTLTRSASFASTILWPPHLGGQEFLTFRRARRGHWFRRVFTVQLELTKPVLDAINAE
jgi:hypothetical protein